MTLSRRGFGSVLIGSLSFYGSTAAFAQAPNFDAEFQKLQEDEQLLANTQEFGRAKENVPLARGTVRSREKSDRKISQRAIDLIIVFEVSSKAVYQHKYQGVIKPGGASGITIGIGYDVGYVSANDLREDWQGFISDADIRSLTAACGVTGNAASALRPQLSQIKIPWDVANKQFLANVLPIYVAATLNALPNAKELSDDSLGALVSLVYNRGPSFRLTGPRYEEMRQISKLVQAKKYPDVADQISHMARLWTTPDVIGVAKRRQLEALLYREGLTA